MQHYKLHLNHQEALFMKQSKLSKLLLATVLAGLTLTACEQKPQETTAAATETSVKTDEKTTTATETAEKDGEQHEHDDKHEGHDHDDKHDHDGHDHHDHDHDHAHGHDHQHEGAYYQCGDKKVRIVVHNHEGEIEAHLTTDDIEYDLNQDPANTDHYTTNDGIQGDNKPMTLILKDSTAKVVAADQSVLLDCTKTN